MPETYVSFRWLSEYNEAQNISPKLCELSRALFGKSEKPNQFLKHSIEIINMIRGGMKFLLFCTARENKFWRKWRDPMCRFLKRTGFPQRETS